MSRRKTGNSNCKELMRRGHALYRIRVFYLYCHVHAIQSFENQEKKIYANVSFLPLDVQRRSGNKLLLAHSQSSKSTNGGETENVECVCGAINILFLVDGVMKVKWFYYQTA